MEPYTFQTNTRGDDLSQMATEYTPVEIAYFRALVKAFNHLRVFSSMDPIYSLGGTDHFCILKQLLYFLNDCSSRSEQPQI